ncbi:MAG: hypothetical protein DWI03_03125 [Planctomycetota bacterium]|nr:MAG: hypothetical protein DWI03_03125 [Planctomycetota bacterium]
MNVIGKIFVFAVFVMSLVLMTFAGAIYMSHVNWKDEVERDPNKVLPGQKPGYRYQLDEADKKRKELDEQINDLTRKVAASEEARDQVVAKLQSAISQKNDQLTKLLEDKKRLEVDSKQRVEAVNNLTIQVEQTGKRIEELQAQVRSQQGKVDQHVQMAADLAAELAEQKSLLAIADERKAQLEKQVAKARELLKQSGLSLESQPKDRVPQLDGDVIAVAASSIEVSIGSDDGLQVGHTLEVYRSGQYVGRAIVRSVRPDRAVAEIDKNFSRGTVQRGDKVTTKVKS